jgi:hypothetical protein
MPHTPGDWKLAIEGTGTGRGPIIYVDDRDDELDVRELADLETSEVRDGPSHGKYRWKRKADAEEIEANAHLMCAAPLLLEAARKAQYALSDAYLRIAKDENRDEAQRLLERAISAAIGLAAVGAADGRRIPLSQNQQRIARQDREFRTLKRRVKSVVGKGR